MFIKDTIQIVDMSLKHPKRCGSQMLSMWKEFIIVGQFELMTIFKFRLFNGGKLYNQNTSYEMLLSDNRMGEKLETLVLVTVRILSK